MPNRILEIFRIALVSALVSTSSLVLVGRAGADTSPAVLRAALEDANKKGFENAALVMLLYGKYSQIYWNTKELTQLYGRTPTSLTELQGAFESAGQKHNDASLATRWMKHTRDVIAGLKGYRDAAPTATAAAGAAETWIRSVCDSVRGKLEKRGGSFSAAELASCVTQTQSELAVLYDTTWPRSRVAAQSASAPPAAGTAKGAPLAATSSIPRRSKPIAGQWNIAPKWRAERDVATGRNANEQAINGLRARLSSVLEESPGRFLYGYAGGEWGYQAGNKPLNCTKGLHVLVTKVDLERSATLSPADRLKSYESVANSFDNTPGLSGKYDPNSNASSVTIDGCLVEIQAEIPSSREIASLIKSGTKFGPIVVYELSGKQLSARYFYLRFGSFEDGDLEILVSVNGAQVDVEAIASALRARAESQSKQKEAASRGWVDVEARILESPYKNIYRSVSANGVCNDFRRHMLSAFSNYSGAALDAAITKIYSTARQYRCA